MSPKVTISEVKNEVVEMIACNTIAESTTNQRKSFDEAGLAAMAETMKADGVGVIQPIILRPHPAPKGKITKEVIAGARRLRSAILAGLAHIPSIVRNYTDEQVRPIQLVENLQRTDLHPLEEGDGYTELNAQPGYTPEVIAEKTGKKPDYVYKRMTFSRLIPEVRDVFARNLITISHALEISRLPAEHQLTVFNDLLFETDQQRDEATGQWVEVNTEECVSLNDLRNQIDRSIFVNLDNAPWDLADATLLPAAGSCNDCPKRSGTNPMLFDAPEDTSQDTCLDRTCFKAKSDAFLIQITAAKESEGVMLVKLSEQWNGNPELEAIGRDHFKVVEGKGCKSVTEGVYVDGTERGKVIRVCVDLKCKTHHPNSANYGSAGSASGVKDYWAEKEKKLTSHIDLAVRRAVVASIAEKPMVWGVPHEQLQVIATKLLPYSVPTELLDAMAIPGVPLGEKRNGSEVKDVLAGFIASGKGTAKAKELPRIIVGLTLLEFVKEFGGGDKETLSAAAKAFGVDDKKIHKETDAEMRKAFAEKKAKSEAKKLKAETPKEPKAKKAAKKSNSSKGKPPVKGGTQKPKKGGKK